MSDLHERIHRSIEEHGPVRLDRLNTIFEDVDEDTLADALEELGQDGRLGFTTDGYHAKN